MMQMAGADPGMAVYPVPPSKYFIASASNSTLSGWRLGGGALDQVTPNPEALPMVPKALFDAHQIYR